MTKLALLFIATIVFAGCATQSVLRLDQDRIISLARQAIAEQEKELDLDSLDFVDITYRFDAEQREIFRVGFRHAPKSETETTEDDGRTSTRTVTKYKAVIVNLDKTGKILSVDGGGSSSRIEIKSTRSKTVQPQD